MTNSKLESALNELDTYLGSKSLTIEIVICGAFAIYLHGFVRAEFTLDVDTMKEINSKEVLEAIKEIGKKLGLGEKWLNDQASTVAIPDGTFARAKKLDSWKSINAYLADRSDLIKMKAAAFSIRRDTTHKDWDDLELLKPNKEEVEAAIRFLKATNSPPEGSSKKLIDEFMETINDLKTLV